MIKLIGIAAKARSGKDTLARHLRRKYGFRRMAFADPVRDTCAAVLGVSAAVFHDDDAKTLPVPGLPHLTVRQALIDVGMGLRNSVHPDIWLDRWHRDFLAVPDYEPVVVPDVRLDNEAQRIRQLGGLILHLRRDGAGLNEKVDAKGSEDGVTPSDADALIENNGTLDEFTNEVDQLIAFLTSHRDTTHFAFTD